MRYSKWVLVFAVVILFSTIGHTQDVLVLDETRNRFLIDEKSTEPRLDVIVQSFSEYERKGISEMAVIDTATLPTVKKNGANNYTINASRMGEKLTFVVRGGEKLKEGWGTDTKYLGMSNSNFQGNSFGYQLKGEKCSGMPDVPFGIPGMIIKLRDNKSRVLFQLTVNYSYPAPELIYVDVFGFSQYRDGWMDTLQLRKRIRQVNKVKTSYLRKRGVPDSIVVGEDELYFAFKPAYYDGRMNKSRISTRIDAHGWETSEEHNYPFSAIFSRFSRWYWIQNGSHTLSASYYQDGKNSVSYQFGIQHSRRARIIFLLSVFLKHTLMNYPWVFLLIPGSIIFLIFRRRLKRANQLAARNTLELQAIQAQLNPHFMFNSLGSIQGLIHKNEIEKASTYLTDFSKLLRNSLITNGKEVVPLSVELHTLDSYIKLEKLRFNFQYDLHVDESIETTNVEIPSLLIQPLIENAIKHGIASSGDHGLLSVSFLKNDRDLVIEIKDNGKGFDASRPVDGQGIQLTRKRITYLNKQGNKIKLDIVSEAGQGCLARLVLKQIF